MDSQPTWMSQEDRINGLDQWVITPRNTPFIGRCTNPTDPFTIDPSASVPGHPSLYNFINPSTNSASIRLQRSCTSRVVVVSQRGARKFQHYPLEHTPAPMLPTCLWSESFSYLYLGYLVCSRGLLKFSLKQVCIYIYTYSLMVA